MALRFSLAILIFLAKKSTSDCSDTTGGCFPSTENVAQMFSATSTCGNPPTLHCPPEDQSKPDPCFFCDATLAVNTSFHPEELAVDRNFSTFWQSATKDTELIDIVTVQVNLSGSFQLEKSAMIFHTYRPQRMVLEKSNDFGATWTALQYYAPNCTAASATDNDFSGVSTIPDSDVPNQLQDNNTVNTTAVCITRDSTSLVPETGGEVTYDVGLRHGDNRFDVETIVNHALVTNLRARFRKLATQGDELVSSDPKTFAAYYYAIEEWTVDARCYCYGHSNECKKDGDKITSECACKGNTDGANCERCLPLFNNKPYMRGNSTHTNPCEECQCNNHADSCTYNETKGFGVCNECQHNTTGDVCEQCLPTFFRDAAKAITNPDVCKVCDCDVNGTLACSGVCGANSVQCDKFSGNCTCKTNVMGAKCNTCKDGFFNLTTDNPNGCSECQCSSSQSFAGTICDKITGQCDPPLFSGRECAHLKDVGNKTLFEIRVPQQTIRYRVIVIFLTATDNGSVSFVVRRTGNNTYSCSSGGNVTGQQLGNTTHTFTEATSGYVFDLGLQLCLEANKTVFVDVEVQKSRETLCLDSIILMPLPDDIKEAALQYDCALDPILTECKQLTTEFGAWLFQTAFECECDGTGSNNSQTCETFGGQGFDHAVGRTCGQCERQFFNSSTQSGCQACNCSDAGTVPGSCRDCNQTQGTCTCKSNVEPKNKCTVCKDGFFNLSSSNADGCSPCICSLVATSLLLCDKVTGVCPCKRGLRGDSCTQVQPGFYVPGLEGIIYEGEDAELTMGAKAETRLVTDPASFSGRGCALLEDAGHKATFEIQVPQQTIRYRVIVRYVAAAETGLVSFAIRRTGINTYSCSSGGSVTGQQLGINSVTFIPAPTGGIVDLGLEGCLEAKTTVFVDAEVQTSRDTLCLDSIILMPLSDDIEAVATGGNFDLKFDYDECYDDRDDGLAPVRPVCEEFEVKVSAWLFGGAVECECTGFGATTSVICEAFGGQCNCIDNVVGRTCSDCAYQVFNQTDGGCQGLECDSSQTFSTLTCLAALSKKLANDDAFTFRTGAALTTPLSRSTGANESLSSEEISKSVDVLESLVAAEESALANGSLDLSPFLETYEKNFVLSTSNLLEAGREDALLNLTALAGAPRILKAAERFGRVSAAILGLQNRPDRLLAEENLVVALRAVTADNVTAVSFPNYSDSVYSPWENQSVGVVRLSSSLLQSLLSDGQGSLYISSVLFRNMEDVMPVYNNSDEVAGSNNFSIESHQNSSSDSRSIGTAVVSTSITRLVNGRYTSMPATQTLPGPVLIDYSNIKRGHYHYFCSFWNFSSTENVSGYWSSSGIETQQDGNSTTCNSSHLTSFAVLVAVKGHADIKVLEYFTYIGCGISLLALLITLVFLLTFRKFLHKERTLVNINFTIALMLALTFFLAGIDQSSNRTVCKAMAVIMHYLFICVFTWTLCEGLLIYFLLVVVFDSGESRMKRYLLLGWGLPLVIVATSFGIRYDDYGQFQYCFLTFDKGMIWTFVGPMLAIILVNTVFFVIAMKKLLSRKTMDKSKKALAKSALRGIAVLLPVLGLTWIIGIFAIDTLSAPLAYIFTIVNSLQGFSIFLFHVVFDEQMRKAIKHKRDKHAKARFLEKSSGLSPRVVWPKQYQLAGDSSTAGSHLTSFPHQSTSPGGETMVSSVTASFGTGSISLQASDSLLLEKTENSGLTSYSRNLKSLKEILYSDLPAEMEEEEDECQKKSMSGEINQPDPTTITTRL